MNDREINAEPGHYPIDEPGPTFLETRYSSEAWQFFAFVFAAVLTLMLSFLEVLAQNLQPLMRMGLNALVFGGLAYATLFNETIKRGIVRVLSRVARKDRR